MSDDFDPFELIPRKKPQSSGSAPRPAQGQPTPPASGQPAQQSPQPAPSPFARPQPGSQPTQQPSQQPAPPPDASYAYAPRPARADEPEDEYLQGEFAATATMPDVASVSARPATQAYAQPGVAPNVQPQPQPRPAAQPARRRGSTRTQRGGFWRGLGTGLLTFLVLMAFAIGIGLIGYSLIAGGDLPDIDEFSGNISTFQTTRFYDREGNLLNATFDLNEGLRTRMPLYEISQDLRDATIATEDANFYRHEGVDPVALLRALYYAVQEGDVVSGASTIPQQLVKMILLTPEQTITRKVKEAILASEMSRIYEKDDILEFYLNEINYGNLSYGAAAAAETYFNKDVSDLTLAEAALLAGLPQLPAWYDPYIHPDRAKDRQAVVLGLMVEQGYITQEEADAAWQEPLVYSPQEFNLEAPHFTLYVRQQVEELFGPDALYRAGLNVETTLDPRLQNEAERIVLENVQALSANNISNGALVAMDPRTGEVLALVGSADFDNVEIAGQVNMALAPRQPGSTIKPLVYLATMEQQPAPDAPTTGGLGAGRWTPGTLIADIREAFPDGVNPPYVPTNYDGREHGLLTMRSALGNSYNIPAVRALQHVGIPAFLDTTQRLGITTLTRPDYGLSLSLGAGEIPLVEMTSAFGTLANGGVRQPPVTIRRITDALGNVLCGEGSSTPCQYIEGAGAQVINPVDAFLLTDILSDNEARSTAFGPNSILRLSRPAAAKTGTTNDIRDILTIGYTPQLVTGVWVGNADNSPMVNVSGVSGAGPIWNQFMTVALADEPVLEFTPPPGVRQVEICADTGTLPSPACPEKRMQWFAEDRPPLPATQDLWQTIRLDRNTQQPANEFTPPDVLEEKNYKVYPEEYRAWAQENGVEQPPFLPQPVPTGEDQILPPAPTVELAILAPQEGETVSGVVTAYGTVDIPNLLSYELQYGETHDPGAFSLPVAGPYGGVVRQSALGQWDTSALAEGAYTLRLLARDANGAQYEARTRLFVLPPLPTPEPVQPTATWTPPPPLNTTETPVYFPPPEQATEAPIVEPPVVEPPVFEMTIEPPPLNTTETPVYFPPPGGEATPDWTPTWTPMPSEGEGSGGEGDGGEGDGGEGEGAVEDGSGEGGSGEGGGEEGSVEDGAEASNWVASDWRGSGENDRAWVGSNDEVLRLIATTFALDEQEIRRYWNRYNDEDENRTRDDRRWWRRIRRGDR